MVFLTPIPAIIAAAIAVPLLISLFLLKLRRRPRRVGSTMLWEQAVRDLQANVPLRWLRPSVLLLLSLLVLTLLLLALARPAIEGRGGSGERYVLLIDRSMSMSAADAGGGRTRLEAAKREALEVVARWRRQGFSGRAAVVAFAAEPRALTAMGEDLTLLESAIASIEPSDQPADAAAALALAQALLAAPAGEEGERVEPGRAILFSDGGLGGAEGLSIAGATAGFVRVGPEEAAAKANVGIAAMSARRDWEDPSRLRVFLRAQNASSREVAASARLTLDGRPAGVQALVVPPSGDRGPGERALTFELANLRGGVLRAEIEAEDALASDNSAALVVPSPRRPAIMVVRPAGVDDPARWVLDEVLRGLEPRGLWVLDEGEYERALVEGSLGEADVLLFDVVRPERVPAIPSLHLGAGLAGLELGGAGGATPVVRWRREHAVLRHVTLDPVYVASPRGLGEGQGVTALAWGREGPLMALGEVAGAPRLVVAFDLAESNWASHYGFAIFVASAVEFLTQAGEGPERSLTTTDVLRVRPVGAGGEVVVRDDEGVVVRRARAGREATTVTLAPLERSGVYTLEGAEPAVVAVNAFWPAEIAIATRDALSVSGERVEATGGEGASRRELWPWLVLAALVLGVVEWMLYAWRMRV